MTLHTYNHVEQRSDEWHTLRRGSDWLRRITENDPERRKKALEFQSVVDKIFSFGGTRSDSNESPIGLARRFRELAGFTDDNYVSNAMWRGIEDEPRAIEQYSKDYQPVTTVGFMIHEYPTFNIGYSPDGLVGDDGLIEIKSRSPKEQVLVVLSDQVPLEHMAQLQCGLLVSGRAWIDYVSYCGGLPMWVKRVEPDQAWQTAILTAATAFEAACHKTVTDFTKATAGLSWTERVDHSIPFGLEF